MQKGLAFSPERTKSDIKSKFAGHLLDDIQLDGGRILLVVNGEECYATLVFGNDGIGCDDAGTTRLASPLRCERHKNLFLYVRVEAG